MTLFNRRTRSLLSALVLVVVLTAVLTATLTATAPAHRSSGTTVNVRVETPAKTLFNGPVITGPGTIRTESSAPCDGVGEVDSPVNSATPLIALTDVAEDLAMTMRVVKLGIGSFLCQLGDLTGSGTSSWKVKVNNKSKVGQQFVTGDWPLKPNDEVLWYYATTETGTLAIEMPKRAKRGQKIKVKVKRYSNDGSNTGTYVDGVTVKGFGNKFVTDHGGVGFIRVASKSGNLLFTATGKTGQDVRGSARICIFKPGTGGCGTKGPSRNN